MPDDDHPRPIPAPAREVAQRLAAMFERDRELTAALNDAQQRLFAACDQLTAGLSAEALRTIYGPMGPDLGLSGRKPPVLVDEQPIAALERVAETIRRAFVDYQHRADERRVLGLDVGKADVELVATMVDAGFSVEEAHNADVHAVVAGIYRPVQAEPILDPQPTPPRRGRSLDLGIGDL